MSSVTESVDVTAPLTAVPNQWTQFESFPHNRQVRSDLLRFREFIENRGAETGGWRGDVEVAR